MDKPIYFELDDLSHDPKLAEELGHALVAWSKAEVILGLVLSYLLETEPNMALDAFARIPTFKSRTKCG